ncbi:TPA: hypothetical protein ACJXXT_000252 [Pseudomonas aeruginosa]
MKKTPIDNQLVKDLYLTDQKTPTEIATALGITKSRVYQILDKLNIERRPHFRKETQELKATINKLFTENKLPSKDIAKATGMNISTVINHLKDLGLFNNCRNNPRVFIDKETLTELYIVQGLPASKIAQMYGITESCVYGKLSKHNIRNGVRDKVRITKDTLYRLFITEGKTAGEIAKLYNLKVTTVFSKLNKHGIKRHKQCKPTYAEIQNLLESGLSQRTIAERFNISQATISLTVKNGK